MPKGPHKRDSKILTLLLPCILTHTGSDARLLDCKRPSVTFSHRIMVLTERHRFHAENDDTVNPLHALVSLI